MIILLTGATSFVGRHLIERLNSTNHEIIPIVRSPKGLKNEIIWNFQDQLPDNLPKCDIIIHLAA
jgi:nucleoside-diphosphate-sugar epimerase